MDPTNKATMVELMLMTLYGMLVSGSNNGISKGSAYIFFAKSPPYEKEMVGLQSSSPREASAARRSTAKSPM